MASFDSSPQDRIKIPSKRYPYRRLDPSVKKFVKVLQVDLDRLSKHRSNIRKYQAAQEWQLLTKEQINSSRTVKQLKANIRQLEQTRAQILPDEQAKFDKNIGNIQHKTMTAIIEFLDLQAEYEMSPVMGLSQQQSLLREGMDRVVAHKVLAERQHSLEAADNPPGDSTILSGSTSMHDGRIRTQEQKQLTINKAATAQAQEAWQDLKSSLVELNSLIHEFSATVHSQQESINCIEDNIEHAQVNVEAGVQQLGTAAKLKSAVFPVAGALIGGALGGPVGLVAGIKLGGLAAVTGGLAGFTGGHLLKKKRSRAADLELSRLSSRSSQTLPDVVSASDTPDSPTARSSYSDPGS